MCGGLTICGNPTRKAAVATEGVRHNSFGNADLVTSTLFRAGPSWVSRDVHMLGKCRLDCVEKFMLHIATCCRVPRGAERSHSIYSSLIIYLFVLETFLTYRYII